MITTLMAAALAVAPFSPPDGQPEMIGPEFVEFFIALPDAQGVCDAYGTVVDSLNEMGMEYSTAAVMIEAADAMVIVTMEGDSMRLDNEARDVLTEWLHQDCA